MKLITNSNFTYAQNIVIVSLSLDETITKCVRNNMQSLETKFEIILLQELLFNYEIFDKLDDNKASIQWIKNLKSVSNTDHYLLNRITYVPNSLFANFSKADREYAQREFEAYIGFAFNAFTGIGNNFATGLCVENLSLPKQWNMVNKNLKLTVPIYHWGPNNFSIPNNKIVHSDIFNFLNWAISSKPQDSAHVFCFEKPLGNPVFVFSIGDKQLITTDLQLNTHIKNRLQFLAKKINILFKYFISEILFFVNDDKLIFGCINSEVIRSSKHPEVENFICKNLVREFYRWMN